MRMQAGGASLLAGIVWLTIATTPARAEGDTVFGLAELTGAAPFSAAAGDPDGSGVAELAMSPAEGTHCFDLFVDKIGTATAAHIHKVVEDFSDPIALVLFSENKTAQNELIGCTDAAPSLLRDIAENPAGYYVDVHSEERPGGALFGIIRRVANLAAGPLRQVLPEGTVRNLIPEGTRGTLRQIVPEGTVRQLVDPARNLVRGLLPEGTLAQLLSPLRDLLRQIFPLIPIIPYRYGSSLNTPPRVPLSLALVGGLGLLTIPRRRR